MLNVKIYIVLVLRSLVLMFLHFFILGDIHGSFNDLMTIFEKVIIVNSKKIVYKNLIVPL